MGVAPPHLLLARAGGPAQRSASRLELTRKKMMSLVGISLRIQDDASRELKRRVKYMQQHPHAMRIRVTHEALTKARN